METGVTEHQTFPPGGEGTLVETPAEHDVFPPFDSTTFASQLLWFAITFALLYYLMAKVALPRIAGILEDRRDRIASDLDLAEGLKRDSETALESYEKALAEARARANAIAEGARDGARQAAAAKRAAIETSLAEKLQAAEKRIGEIKAKALADVGEIATEATEAVVASLVEIELGEREIADAVSSVISGQERRHA
jgi:F-type H+-transporting ATPase subunit b